MKLKICIPTYKRPKAIEELLQRFLDTYLLLGFDIHIYDSSDDEETYSVVKPFMGCEKLYYHRVDPTVHSNVKVLNIYKEFADGDYDYIWVQSDSIRWTIESLNRISDAINSNQYDIITPNYRDEEKIGDKIYEDKEEFFRDCAWHLTLYGAAILNKKLLYNVEWEAIHQKYTCSERINFSHVALYFEQIAKAKSFKGFHIGLPQFSLTSTMYKKESGWRKDTFFIHCVCWPSVINALPNIYRDKEEVIKKQGFLSGDLTNEGLKRLRSEKVLSLSEFVKYRKEWKNVSDISALRFLFFSIIPAGLAKALMIDQINERKIKRQIRNFSKKYENIFIYGCGQKGDSFANYMDEMRIAYKGFIISKGRKDKEYLHNKPVLEFDENLLYKKTNGIILALNELNTKQVLTDLKKYDVKAGLYSEYLE